MPPKPIFSVLLAAGQGRRYGSGKALAKLAGEPLVRRALRTAEAACGAHTVTVVGDDWRALYAACAPLAGFLVRNDDPAAGLASSIAAGVHAAADAAGAVLLLLADQPFIEPQHLATLIDRWDGHAERIVCCSHDGVLSPPSLFPATYFDDLCGLRGDAGARSVLQKYADRVIAVPCPAAAVDVDTPADLAHAEAKLRR